MGLFSVQRQVKEPAWTRITFCGFKLLGFRVQGLGLMRFWVRVYLGLRANRVLGFRAVQQINN